MITEYSLNHLLQKVQVAPRETLLSHSVCFEGMVPGDSPNEKWVDILEQDAPEMRAAIRMGLITIEFKRWVQDGSFRNGADGGDYLITLSGLGTERLIALNESKLSKIRKQILTNLPTIIVSVVISLLVAWSIFLLGPREQNPVPQGVTATANG